jgi:hypothetical protein
VLFAAYDPVGGYLFEQCVQGRLLLGVQDRKHSLFCLGERVLDLGESASFIEVLGSAVRARSSSSRLTPHATSPTGCTPGSSNGIQGYD